MPFKVGEHAYIYTHRCVFIITAAVYQSKYCEKARRNRQKMTEAEAAGKLPHSGICKCIGYRRCTQKNKMIIDD